jgi:hypothetical protein
LNVSGGQAIVVSELRRIADEIEANGKAELQMTANDRKGDFLLSFTRRGGGGDDAMLLAEIADAQR